MNNPPPNTPKHRESSRWCLGGTYSLSGRGVTKLDTDHATISELHQDAAAARLGESQEPAQADRPVAPAFGRGRMGLSPALLRIQENTITAATVVRSATT